MKKVIGKVYITDSIQSILFLNLSQINPIRQLRYLVMLSRLMIRLEKNTLTLMIFTRKRATYNGLIILSSNNVRLGQESLVVPNHLKLSRPFTMVRFHLLLLRLSKTSYIIVLMMNASILMPSRMVFWHRILFNFRLLMQNTRFSRIE